MLVINDSMNLETDKMFQGSGVDAEVILVRDMTEGIAQLDAWAKDGHAADIVTIDCHKKIGDNILGLINVSWTYQQRLEDWSEQQPESLRPKKTFWHSGIEMCHPKEVGFHDMTELSNIGRFGGGHYRFIHIYGDTPLTEYVNREWNTNLPTTNEQIGELAIQAGELTPYGMAKDVAKGEYTEFQALKGLDINSINLRPYLNTKKYPTGSEWFEFSTPGVARGSIAFDESDVHKLRAKGKSEVTGSKRNDLQATQAWMTEHNVPVSPFITLAPQVSDVMRQAIRAAKAAKPEIHIGICGDQVSGNLSSIKVCGELGLDAISVQPTTAAIIESRIMAGKAYASTLTPEKLTRKLKDVEQGMEQKSPRSFAGKHPKRKPLEADGTGWGKGKTD